MLQHISHGNMQLLYCLLQIIFINIILKQVHCFINCNLILENPPCMHFPEFQEYRFEIFKYFIFLMLDDSHVTFALEIAM